MPDESWSWSFHSKSRPNPRKYATWRSMHAAAEDSSSAVNSTQLFPASVVCAQGSRTTSPSRSRRMAASKYGARRRSSSSYRESRAARSSRRLQAAAFPDSFSSSSRTLAMSSGRRSRAAFILCIWRAGRAGVPK